MSSFTNAIESKNKQLSKILEDPWNTPQKKYEALIKDTLGLHIFMNLIIINIKFVKKYAVIIKFIELLEIRSDIISTKPMTPKVAMDIELCFMLKSSILKAFAIANPIEYVENSQARKKKIVKYKYLIRQKEFIDWFDFFVITNTYKYWSNSTELDYKLVKTHGKERLDKFQTNQNVLWGNRFFTIKWKKNTLKYIVQTLNGICEYNLNNIGKYSEYERILIHIKENYLKDQETIEKHIKKMYLDKIVNDENYCFTAFY